jgi:hypothetical protein
VHRIRVDARQHLRLDLRHSPFEADEQEQAMIDYDALAISLSALALAAIVVLVLARRKRRKKIVADPAFDEEMQWIRAYVDYRREN